MWDGNAHTICYPLDDIESAAYYKGFFNGWHLYGAVQSGVTY
jgi:hypothetical protein